jgi:hypothetical protein
MIRWPLMIFEFFWETFLVDHDDDDDIFNDTCYPQQ